MAKKPLILELGANGEVRLPDDALRALEVQPGEKLSLRIDTRHKQIITGTYTGYIQQSLIAVHVYSFRLIPTNNKQRYPLIDKL